MGKPFGWFLNFTPLIPRNPRCETCNACRFCSFAKHRGRHENITEELGDWTSEGGQGEMGLG